MNGACIRFRGGTMQWKFLAGASFLTCALLLPYAPPGPVAVGIVIAAAVQWAFVKLHRS
jgi:hypothetical protein